MLFIVVGDNRETVRQLSLSLHMRWPDAEVLATPGLAKARDLLETEAVDLLFVDLTAQEGDYTDLLEQVRAFSDVPIMLLGSNTSDVARARALEYGADDNFAWPGSALELLARVKAVMRRAQGQGFRPDSPAVVMGDLTINPNTAEVLLHGRRVSLTPIEFRLLTALTRNQGRVVASQVLLERVWGSDYKEEAGFLKSYVYRLRHKLEGDSGRHLILTERGRGYKFVAPLEGGLTAGVLRVKDAPTSAPSALAAIPA